MTRYAPFIAVCTIKCEWCGRRVDSNQAICEAQVRQCYCSDACFQHAGSLLTALQLAITSDRFIYTGSRGVQERTGVLTQPAARAPHIDLRINTTPFADAVAQALRAMAQVQDHRRVTALPGDLREAHKE